MNKAAPILFVHGWATDSWVWEGFARSLGRDFHNIDLPGHGGRGKWAEPTLAPAISEIERYLSGLPDRSATGIGWSLGAEALIASSLQSRKFKNLILVGGTPSFVEREGFPCGQSRALVKRMILDMRKDPEETVNRFYGLNFTGSEITSEQAKRFMERYKYPGPVVCGTEAPGCFPAFRYDEITKALEALYSMDLRDGLGRLDIPALIIHGALDTICPPDAGRFLASNIKGAELVIFENAGHAPFLTEAARFNRVASDFLEGR